jgi:CTP synthase (UTP-ammonia lyase)
VSRRWLEPHHLAQTTYNIYEKQEDGYEMIVVFIISSHIPGHHGDVSPSIHAIELQAPMFTMCVGYQISPHSSLALTLQLSLLLFPQLLVDLGALGGFVAVGAGR